MIKQEKFISLVRKYEEYSETIDSLSALGIEFPMGSDHPLNVADILFNEIMSSSFGEDGLDTILWWMFDSAEKKIYDNGDVINVEKIEDLYKYLSEKGQKLGYFYDR